MLTRMAGPSYTFHAVALACVIFHVGADDQISMLQHRVSHHDQQDHDVAKAGTQMEKEVKGTECGGITAGDATKWETLNENQICVVVDTSSCEFSGEPMYFPSLHGSRKHDETYGGAMVIAPTETNFKICVGYKGITPADAKKWKWHVSWLGYGETKKPLPADTYVCYGRSIGWEDLGGNRQEAYKKMVRVGKWESNSEISDVFFMNVNTEFCGFTETPTYVVRLGHELSNDPLRGCEAVLKPHAKGFIFNIHGWKNTGAIARSKIFGNFTLFNKNHNQHQISVHFAALGKAPLSRRPKFAVPDPSPFGRWRMLEKDDKNWVIRNWAQHKWQMKLDLAKETKCYGGEARNTKRVNPVHMMSVVCPEPWGPYWNMTNMGAMNMMKCRYFEVNFNDPFMTPDFPRWDYWNSLRKGGSYAAHIQASKDLSKHYKNKCKVALLHNPLPLTPPPTPPTPAPPTPRPTPPTPSPTTPAPTPMAATESTDKKDCCDV